MSQTIADQQARSGVKYLCDKQGTRFPLLPIHTTEERQLFKQLISDQRAATGSSAVNFRALAVAFNARADGTSVFYKTTEYMKLHHRKLKDLSNQHNSRVESAGQRETFNRHLTNLSRLVELQPVPDQNPAPTDSILATPINPPAPAPATFPVIIPPSFLPQNSARLTPMPVSSRPGSATGRARAAPAQQQQRTGHAQRVPQQATKRHCLYCASQQPEHIPACPGSQTLKLCQKFMRLTQHEKDEFLSPGSALIIGGINKSREKVRFDCGNDGKCTDNKNFKAWRLMEQIKKANRRF